MQNQMYAFRWISASRLAALFICALLLMSFSSVSQAQSGRRPPKQPKSPDPLPSKQEEPPIKSSPEQDSKQIIVKVVWYIQTVNLSTYYVKKVQEGCLEQLSHSGSVKAASGEDLNRKEAIDIAKGSTDTYVLWYQLEADALTADPSAINAAQLHNLYVRYEVFTPGTGKTKTSGRVFQRPQGPGGVPLPTGTPASAEYSLRYAGREMANRLLDTLRLPHPDRH